jgi:hypothetical protein
MAISAQSCPALAAGAIAALLLAAACRAVESPEVVTLLGGSGTTDLAQACFVDRAGFLYLGGNTGSDDFPTTPGVLQPAHHPEASKSRQDGFVAKLTPDGRSLVWSTYLGGSGRDHVMGLRVDAEGYVYAVGWTRSPDFPATPGGLHRSSSADGDIFVAKFAPDASQIEYVARVGGSAGASTHGSFELDPEGRVWVLGATRSSDFPTTADALQPVYGGVNDGVLFALSSDGARLEYSTFLGGTEHDDASGLARHADGTLYAAGWTRSPDFPVTPGVVQERFAGAAGGVPDWGGDVWLARFSADGRRRLFSTFFGGPASDASAGNQPLAVTREGNAVLIGRTWGSVPTTAGAFLSEPETGTPNPFVLVLAPDGSRVVASTLTSSRGEMSGLAVDGAGRVYHTGRTSPGLVTTRNAFQPGFGGGDTDTFLSVFSPDLTTLLYSSYLGGSGDGQESSRCLSLGPRGQLLMSGDSGSRDFPTTPGAFQERNAGRTSGFGAVWPPSVTAGAGR